jgi:hypothetical protein
MKNTRLTSKPPPPPLKPGRPLARLAGMATVRHRTIRSLPSGERRGAAGRLFPRRRATADPCFSTDAGAVSTPEKSIGTRDEAGEGTGRRRVISYTGDTRVYRHRRTGGQVVDWASPETGNRITICGSNTCQQHQQHIRSIYAACAATMKTDNPAPSVETDGTSLCVQREGLLYAAEMKSTHPAPSPVGSACVSVCAPGKTAD